MKNFGKPVRQRQSGKLSAKRLKWKRIKSNRTMHDAVCDESMEPGHGLRSDTRPASVGLIDVVRWALFSFVAWCVRATEQTNICQYYKLPTLRECAFHCLCHVFEMCFQVLSNWIFSQCVDGKRTKHNKSLHLISSSFSRSLSHFQKAKQANLYVCRTREQRLASKRQTHTGKLNDLHKYSRSTLCNRDGINSALTTFIFSFNI